MNDKKYPYLNSVIFVDNIPPRENEQSRELSINYSCSSSDCNFDDKFHDIDLNGSTGKGCLDYNDIMSWKVDSYSVEALSDDIDGKPTNSTSKCNIPSSIMYNSSISSLSSLTSANDITISQNNGRSPLSINTSNSNKGINTSPSKNKGSSLNILSHITQFINKKGKSANNFQSTPLKSTTCLILNDRPSGLPAKSSEEMKRHQEEYNQLINSIKKKERKQNDTEKAKQQSKLNAEERQIQLTEMWRNFIIPNLFQQKTSKFVRHIWWEGIPTSLRDKVWRLCIPNTLKLTKVHYDNFLSQMKERLERYREMQKDETDSVSSSKVSCEEGGVRLRNGVRSNSNKARSSAYDLYLSETANIHSQRTSSHSSNINMPCHSGTTSSSSETEMRQVLLNTIKLDVSRTFPHLNLFQDGGPHYDSLYQLLGAYTCYRPDIGYVQGMSFLAAILILVMNVEDAFISFANIIEMPCHHALYGLNENEFTVYVESFKFLLLTHLPLLGQHFLHNHLDVNIFLYDWLFTIYSRSLSLETTLLVWDMFCRDGETALFRAGLGILRCYEMQLLNSDFDEMASFLTGQMPESLTPVILVEEMREIRLSKSKFAETLEDVRSRLLHRN